MLDTKGALFVLEALIASTIIIVSILFLFSDPIDLPRFGEETLTFISHDCLVNIDKNYGLREEIMPFVSDGLLSYWQLEIGTGNMAYDYYGDNDGVISGASWSELDGRTVLEFDGSSDYMEANQNLLEKISNRSWTINTWVNVSSEGDNTFIGFISDDYNSFILLRNRDGYPDGRVENVDGDRINLDFDSFESNEWTMVTLTYDYNAGELALYKDGVLVDSDSFDNGTYDIDVSDENPSIGRDGRGQSYLDGYMEEVSIYADALSAEEIERNYERLGNYSYIEDRISEEECFSPLVDYSVQLCNKRSCNEPSLPENRSITSTRYFVAGFGQDYYPHEITLFSWET